MMGGSWGWRRNVLSHRVPPRATAERPLQQSGLAYASLQHTPMPVVDAKPLQLAMGSVPLQSAVLAMGSDAGLLPYAVDGHSFKHTVRQRADLHAAGRAALLQKGSICIDGGFSLGQSCRLTGTPAYAPVWRWAIPQGLARCTWSCARIQSQTRSCYTLLKHPQLQHSSALQNRGRQQGRRLQIVRQIGMARGCAGRLGRSVAVSSFCIVSLL